MGYAILNARVVDHEAPVNLILLLPRHVDFNGLRNPTPRRGTGIVAYVGSQSVDELKSVSSKGMQPVELLGTLDLRGNYFLFPGLNENHSHPVQTRALLMLHLQT
jgi:hypothetical protein